MKISKTLIKKAISNPRYVLLTLLVSPINAIIIRPLSSRPKMCEKDEDLPGLEEVRRFATERAHGAFKDHVVSLFVEAFLTKPKLIVELGVRGGVSTYALEKVARYYGSHLVSVDVEDCAQAYGYKKYLPVKSDDLAIAKVFNGWCSKKHIVPEIDFLFIDTSHIYKHTKEGIRLWFPYLSKKSKVVFHDTNLRQIYQRKNGTFGAGWDNKRGVIRALEDYFGCKFNESASFVDLRNGWVVRHIPYGCGFTVLEKGAISHRNH